MKKFIFGLILCLMIQLQAFAYVDVSNVTLSSKLDVLSKYDIINGYEDGTFKPNNNITRAEFSKIIMCATINDYITDYDKDFVDVEDGFWAEKYIYSAKKLGIVNGTSNTTFEPNANITNEQAIKMIVCSLGYADEAIAAGGYPNGYIDIAKKIGIISKDDFNSKATSTRQEIAEMVYNALDAEFYFIYLNENNLIERSESENTLREIHELSITENENMDNESVEEHTEPEIDYFDDENAVG